MQDFNSPHSHGFARVAAATIPVAVANPSANAATVIDAASQAAQAGASLVVFPELTLSGNTAGDLFFQDVLLDECEKALEAVAAASSDWPLIALVGAPHREGSKLFDAVHAIARGEVVGTWLKSSVEGEAARWFAPGVSSDPSYVGDVAGTPGLTVSVTDIPGLRIGVNVGELKGCESVMVDYARRGVTVIANPAGAPAVVGQARERREAVKALSRMAGVATVWAGAGEGESTNDAAWDGDAFIVEAGELLAQNERFTAGIQLTYADVDLAALKAAHRGLESTEEWPSVEVSLEPNHEWELTRKLPRFPYIALNPNTWDLDLEDAFNMQVQALVHRLKATGNPKPVLGISGGLDSTLALLVSVAAMEQTGRPRTDILTFTLPGFATSAHTKNNAIALCETLGTTFEEIDIRDTARQMLKDMDHPFGRGEEVYDVTFENVQAGLRTDFLFRIANGRGGLVVGTGDYSELMLGWCTFGVGDHMSHYALNPGLPKTLMQHMIRWIMRTNRFGEGVNATLDSILHTEITPELIPTREGEEAQTTAASIGPYELQDFNAYYLINLGLTPESVAFRALNAWGDAESGEWPEGYENNRLEYSLEEILKWERLFLRRFFANQFKRSTLPNGPKVLEGASLSPRGGLVLGSDIPSTAWLARIDRLADELGLDIEKR